MPHTNKNESEERLKARTRKSPESFVPFCCCAMPKIKTSRTKPPPKGWDLIEPTLREFERKMRDGLFRHNHQQHHN